MAQRNLVLSAATYNNLKGTGISVRTDLPVVLKRKRGELAKTAYVLRKENNLQTIIRERPDRVWLEVRENTKVKWRQYNP